VTSTSRHLGPPSAKRVSGQLEVTLDVPNLGRAVGFYSNVFDAEPAATERHMAWFDVPGATLRIELREALTPTATRLRLCIEPPHLQAVTARLSRGGVAIAQAGLTREGGPREIMFRDPGRNCWNLYSPIEAAAPPMPVRRTGQFWRSLTDSIRAAWASDSGVEARFQQERSRAESLYRHHG
jgi:hypothetical protein